MLAVVVLKLCLRPDQNFKPPLAQTASAEQFLGGPSGFGNNDYAFVVRKPFYGRTRSTRFSQMKRKEAGDAVVVFQYPHKNVVPRRSDSLSELRTEVWTGKGVTGGQLDGRPDLFLGTAQFRACDGPDSH